MTNPEQPANTAHPARAAGYVLLGLAALALIIGVFSLFGGGSDDEPPAAQPTPPSAGASDTPSSPPSDTPDTTTSTTASSPAPADTSPPATSGTPAPTGNPAGQAATDTAPPPVVAKPPVRIYNNSNVSGLAARVTDDVQKAGWQVAETGNYSQGVIPTTTVYYRPGTDEEASAKQLAQILKARVEPRFDGIEAAHPGIIVIATRDYNGPGGKVS